MDLKTLVFCIVLGVLLPIAYVMGRTDGTRIVDDLRVQLAEEDKRAADAVNRLIDDLEMQCEERIEAAQHNYGKG